MKLYWPMAKVKEKDGSIRTQSTYEPCSSVRDALGVITGWSDFYNFNIVDAWIVFKNKNTQEEL